jgi:hypothetical protein
MLDQNALDEVEVPAAEAPDDPDDGIGDDVPLEPIPEDDGAPEDDVPSLIRDDTDVEAPLPASVPSGAVPS